MVKLKVPLTAYAEYTMQNLDSPGCLLVSGKIKKANVMTIGWGLIGRLWGKTVFMVAVRPSRYTHKLIEETGDFTVNVPKKGMDKIVKYCGSITGKNHNKFKEKGLTLLPKNIIKNYYPKRDDHTLYFGEILATFADEDVDSNLIDSDLL